MIGSWICIFYTLFSDKVRNTSSRPHSSPSPPSLICPGGDLSSFYYLNFQDVCLLISSTRIFPSHSDPKKFRALPDSIVRMALPFLRLINSSFLYGQSLADKHTSVKPLMNKPLWIFPFPRTIILFPSKILKSAVHFPLSSVPNCSTPSIQI